MFLLLGLLYTGLLLYWLVVAGLTIRDGIRASELPEEDSGAKRAWVVFAMASAGLIFAGVPMLLAWFTKNWVVAPFNMDEDSIGTSLLFGASDRIFGLMWASLAMFLAVPLLGSMVQ